MRKILSIVVFVVLLMLLVPSHTIAQQNMYKPRTIVTTDGEVDDQDSFIRLLLYSNEFQLEGLIYSSSQWHYKGDGKSTTFISEMENTAKRYGRLTNLRWPGTNWMQNFISQYAQIYPHLIKHDASYPAPAYLQSIVKIGNIDFEGEMIKPTPGSEFIKKTLLDKNPAPVYLQIWGGTNTVACALRSIELQYKKTGSWSRISRLVSSKAIIYMVLDQDATYKKYIEKNWPAIRVMYNSAQFWSFAYDWPRVVPEPYKFYMQGAWMAKNIKFHHGALTAGYFLWGDGQHLSGDEEHTQGDTSEVKKSGMGQYDFISEGDSPAFLYLVNVGLGSISNPSCGGWGGRMIQSAQQPNRWEDGPAVADYNPYTKRMDTSYPQTRWIPEIQNDFAARAAWCKRDYKSANHPPKVGLLTAAVISAKPKSKVVLKGNATDPDKNPMHYLWWIYKEAGSYKGEISITNSRKNKATLIIPADCKRGDLIPVIFQVTDNGSPALTRYKTISIKVI